MENRYASARKVYTYICISIETMMAEGFNG